MEKSYRYLGYVLMLMLPLITVAFHKSYGSKFPNFEPGYDIFIHIHAFFASVWVLMLIVQPLLITYKKLAWHRALGKLSYVIFPLLILSFVPGILKVVDEGAYKFTFFPVSDCVVLILLYSLAMYNRKNSPKHMRYIISSTLTLLGPTIGRIGPIYFGLSDVGTQTLQYAIIFGILGGLILYDQQNNKNYRPYLAGVYAFAAHAAVFYLLFL